MSQLQINEKVNHINRLISMQSILCAIWITAFLILNAFHLPLLPFYLLVSIAAISLIGILSIAGIALAHLFVDNLPVPTTNIK